MPNRPPSSFDQRPARAIAVAATVCMGLLVAACQRVEGPAVAADAAPPSPAALRPVSDTHEPSPGLPAWIARATPDATPDKVKDAAIGAAVASALAREPSLKGYQVEVDSAAGRVILAGLAPDAATRSRAAEVAARVDGVTSVQNQLALAPRGPAR